ncbi:hypothetical protein ACHQM5_019325 [Ranunculus cassubicifolius]
MFYNNGSSSKRAQSTVKVTMVVILGVGDDLADSNVDVNMEAVAEEDVGVAQQSNKRNSSDVWNRFWKRAEKMMMEPMFWYLMGLCQLRPFAKLAIHL